MQYYLTFLCLWGFIPTLPSPSLWVPAVASSLFLQGCYQTSSPSTAACTTGTIVKHSHKQPSRAVQCRLAILCRIFYWALFGMSAAINRQLKVEHVGVPHL